MLLCLLKTPNWANKSWADNSKAGKRIHEAGRQRELKENKSEKREIEDQGVRKEVSSHPATEPDTE